MYPGVLAFYAVILSVVIPPLRRTVKFWLWVMLFSLVVALGEYGGTLNSFLSAIPGREFLRVPPRALFLSGLSGAIMLAALVQYYSVQDISYLKNTWGQRIVFVFTALLVLLAGGLWWMTGKIPVAFCWSAFFSIVFLSVLSLRAHHRISSVRWAALILLVIVIDLNTVDFTLVRFKHVDDGQYESTRAARYLDAQEGIFRVYSPSYSIPQQIAAVYGLELADGIDPMQLREYADYFTRASGVPYTGYSVTLPPFATGDPRTDNRLYLPDTKKLGLLNVQFVVSGYDLLSDGLRLRVKYGETRVYENLHFFPRAWVEPIGQKGLDAIQPVNIVRRTANRIELTAKGPGVLTVSEVNYPGWVAFLDGKQIEIQKTEDLFRSIQLHEGIHTIRFVFRPLSVYCGLLISVLTWALFLVMVIRSRALHG
ncbi:MAG: YfhO family protein [Anaerolineaceae bacterium]|nr:YfhO family protein [Anaerolineaceae bacterium]